MKKINLQKLEHLTFDLLEVMDIDKSPVCSCKETMEDVELLLSITECSSPPVCKDITKCSGNGLALMEINLNVYETPPCKKMVGEV